MLVGLYDDGRFPGRLIVSLVNHYDHLEDVPPGEAASFMERVQEASRALRSTFELTRVNVAILGNQVAHVHAHLIPRRADDPRPQSAPWEDPRTRKRLDQQTREAVVSRLYANLAEVGFNDLRA